MDIKIFNNTEEIAAAASEIIINKVKSTPDAILGLATGASPVATYKKLIAAYEAGEIRYPKIRRQKTRYTLTRTLGGGKDVNPDFSQPEMVRPGDSFLLCTDGFWSNIHERQIEKTLKRSVNAKEWLDKMVTIVDKNIHHKKYSRFRDSYSAITVKI